MNVALFVLSRAVFSLAQWAIVSLLAQWGDPAQVGILGSALATTTLTLGFFGMGLRQGVASDVTGQHADRAYWCFRIFTTTLAGIVVSLYALLARYPAPEAIVSIAILLPKLTETFSELSYGFHQRADRLWVVSLSQLLRGIASVSAFALSFSANHSVPLSVIAWGLTQSAILILFDIRGLRPLKPIERDRSFAEMLALLRTQAPIAAGTLLGDVGLLAPRFAVEAVFSSDTLGLFTAIYYLFQAGNVLVLSFLMGFMSPIARQLAQFGATKTMRVKLLKIQGLIGAVSLFGCLVCWWDGKGVLTLLYGSLYGEQTTVFLLLACGWSARYLALLPRTTFTAGRAFSAGMKLDIANTALVVAGCTLGLLLSGTLVGMCVGFLASQVLSSAYFQIRLHEFLDAKTVASEAA